MRQKLLSLFQSNRVFAFLVIFRWASLLPAVLTVITGHWSSVLFHPALVLAIAILINLVISLTNRQLNELVIKYPAFLGVDLLFTASILAISGGSHSPYYFYALSPLLAGAFFFQMRGALAASLAFTPLYLSGNYFISQMGLFPRS